MRKYALLLMSFLVFSTWAMDPGKLIEPLPPELMKHLFQKWLAQRGIDPNESPDFSTKYDPQKLLYFQLPQKPFWLWITVPCDLGCTVESEEGGTSKGGVEKVGICCAIPEAPWRKAMGGSAVMASIKNAMLNIWTGTAVQAKKVYENLQELQQDHTGGPLSNKGSH